MTGTEDAFLVRMFEEVPTMRAEYEAKYTEYVDRGAQADALQLFLRDHTWAMLDRHGAGHDVAEFGPLVEFFETELGVDPELDFLIDTCFGVHLPDPGPTGEVMGRRLGPKLAAMLEAQWGWQALPRVAAFVDRLTSAVPALGPLADENRYGRRDDVLVHVFLGDVVRREVESYLSGNERALDEVRAVFGLLEAEYDRHAEIDEPIAVSFIENLPGPDEPGADIVELLGPRLTEELLRWWPGRHGGGA